MALTCSKGKRESNHLVEQANKLSPRDQLIGTDPEAPLASDTTTNRCESQFANRYYGAGCHE
jgi:hypothetical protein